MIEDLDDDDDDERKRVKQTQRRAKDDRRGWEVWDLIKTLGSGQQRNECSDCRRHEMKFLPMRKRMEGEKWMMNLYSCEKGGRKRGPAWGRRAWQQYGGPGLDLGLASRGDQLSGSE